jgi:glycosyltransferase involved in cell wall biosynthesis
MKIAHIIPGSGGSFYCGNCLRDSKLFDAIRAEGHDAVKIPMYLPLFAHDHSGREIPVFYGAISLYLKQQFPWLRKAPGWVDKLMNSGLMLRFAAHMANSTRASGLEEMTISMLLGEDGQQKDELEKLTDWLATHLKPDVIHISNALLLGLAHQLREKLQVPVVCSLQDEDVWVEPMHPETAALVWKLMQDKAAFVDRFIPVSRYFSSFMQDKMKLPDHKISTLYLGVEPEEYIYQNASEKPRNIGYLSRMCHENGLDILVDAFILLKKKPDMTDVQLLITGGKTADDNAYIREQKYKINKAGLNTSVEWIVDFEPGKRNDFFSRITTLSVPVRNGEAFGIYLAEAMAAGIPVIQPALGAFPEIIEQSQGGIVYQKNNPDELSAALHKLLSNKELSAELSRNARQSAIETFNIHEQAKKMIGVYEEVVAASAKLSVVN